MTLDLSTKLGQLFFVGFEGFTLSKEIKHFLQTVQPGGIILFECNIKDKNQVKKLIKEINKCLKTKPFITVDQEGGSVERLRNVCTSLPSVWGLSKVGLNELLAAQKIIASELLELGFNMVLAPVLDINSNPKNPVIGTRAISNKPKIVSEYGAKIINLFLKNKIIPVAKHFPGHGDLAIDSHLSLPISHKTKDKLKSFELIPFKKAINNKVPLVMVGHIQFPKIEKDHKIPASLSKHILDELLRKDLGFKGSIITDELNMKGVSKNFSLSDASSLAITAGADMLLFNWSYSETLKTFEQVKKLVDKNKNLSKRIEESYKRIITTKKKYHLVSSSAHRLIGSSAHQNKIISLELSKKVVHWIKKDLFFKPVEKNKPIEVIYPETPKLRKEDLKKIFKELRIRNYRLLAYKLNPDFENVKKIIKGTNKNRRKVLITYDIAARNKQKSLINSLLKLDPSLPVISVGLEYDIEVAPEIKNFVSAYAPNYVSLYSAFKKISV